VQLRVWGGAVSLRRCGNAATWTFILTLQQFCVTSSAIERVAFSFNRRTEPCSIHGNIARDSLEDILQEMGRGEAGTLFNVFRRFREVVLQRSDARQILIDYWMGHSNASMGDRYGRQLVEDIEYRQEQVKKVGLGFELPPRLFGLRGLQIVENIAAA
jgi:hypothetical protein